MGEFVETADPTEVFTAIADDTRMEILQALWDRRDEAVTFSELHGAVSVEDSGQFNYHLSKLVGSFVRDSKEGYHLTQAGKQVIGALASGTYTMETSLEPIELDGSCWYCGGTQTFHYEDEVVDVTCDSCPVAWKTGVPPAVLVDTGREDVPRVASDFLRSQFQHITSGFCWRCHGRTSASIQTAREMPGADIQQEEMPDEFSGNVEDLPMVRYECIRCESTSTVTLNGVFLDHPAVISFYDDHGIDYREEYVWEFPRLDIDGLSITDRDPFRAEVTYLAGDESLTVRTDETLAVVDVTRD